MNIFITGGSGFLGAAIIPHFVRDPRVENVFLLMRDSKKLGAVDRLVQFIEKVFAPEDRGDAIRKLQVVSGDLTLEKMGVSEADYRSLTSICTHILHVGASTDFAAPLSDSREVNVEGTRKVLDFAAQVRRSNPRFVRFDYVSTAFVAGTRAGMVGEQDLERGQGFANAYEQSKYEAEQLVKLYQKQMPIAIHRPSIVVGDSRNGFTPHFKVLYWPLQLLAKNILPFIPCNTRATLDIVPVDFVAKSIYALMTSDKTIGETFHLTAGREGQVLLKRFLKDAFRYTSIRKRPTMPLWVFRCLRLPGVRRLMSEDFWRACELASVYSDYLSGTAVVFDNRRTLRVLADLQVAPAPTWQTYGKEILNYCMQTRWGKRLVMHEYQYRNPLPGES